MGERRRDFLISPYNISISQVGERYATVTLTAASSRLQKDHCDQIKTCLDRLKEVVRSTVQIYAKTFRVNFSLPSTAR